MNNLQSLQELQPQIIEWARERNILFPENAPKQFLKLLEEIGETSSAILKNDSDKIKDGIGDIFVVLVIFFEQIGFKFIDALNINYEFTQEQKTNVHNLNGIINSCYCAYKYSEFNGINLCILGLEIISKNSGFDLTECANIAWNEIKNRKGQTVNGTFIKD